MKKTILLSFATVSLLFADPATKDNGTLEKAMSGFKVKGQIRAIYQSNSKVDFGDLDGDGNNEIKSTSDLLFGGKLGIETAPIEGFSVGATFYTSQPMSNNKDYKDADYYTNDNKGYALLGEAFAKYSSDELEVKIGRMELDLPLVNSDDTRMVPNVYTAATATYKPLNGLNLTAGIVTQIAGWENGINHTRFVKMGEVIESATTDNGGVWDTFFAADSGIRESKLYMAGATYEHEIFGIQTWYGRQTEIMDTYYIEANVKPYESDLFGLNIIGQYMGEKSIGKLKSYAETAGNDVATINGNIYGIGVDLESKELGLTAVVSYNKSGKKDGQHSNGGTASFFGGGKDPLFTSMDVETANGEGDIKAYKGELGFDFAKAGIDGLNASIASAFFDKTASGTYSKETDLTVAYAFGNTSVEAMLTQIKSKDTEDNNRFRVYVKYDF